MELETLLSGNEVYALMLGGAIATVIALGILLTILIFAGFYVYFAWAWMSIGKKLGNKNNWLAWIPVAQFAMILRLGRFHWAWVFLVLLPVVGWIILWLLLIAASWRVFESRNYPGWFALSGVLPKIGWVLYLIALGFVAWGDSNQTKAPKGSSKPKAKTTKRKTTKKKKRR